MDATYRYAKVSDLEWRTLMVGAVAVETSGDGNGGGGSGEGDGGTARPKPANLPWLSGKAWDQLLAYEATLGPAFDGLPAAVASSAEAWKVRLKLDKIKGNISFDVWRVVWRVVCRMAYCDKS